MALYTDRHCVSELTQKCDDMTSQTSPIVPNVRQTQSYMPRVYLAYAAADHSSLVTAIRDWFILRCGPDNVLMDIEIPPFVGSADYYIRDKVGNCDLLVTIIGPNWSKAMERAIQDGEESLTRIEMRAALDARLVMALLYLPNTPPLREIDLPLELRPLFKLPALAMDHQRPFEHEMERILAEIETSAASQPTLDQADVETRINAAATAYDQNDLLSALELLHEVVEHGDVPRPFRLQVRQRMRQIERRLRYSEGQPIYDQLRRLAPRDPVRATYNLALFTAEYPDFGDPDGLLEQLRPVPPDAQAILDELNDPTTPSEMRVKLGESLASFGDPRPGVLLNRNRLPDIAWLKIPAGEFIYNFDRYVELDTFYISRYPITVSQFHAFVQDDGYENPAWWEGMGWREKNGAVPKWPIANYPAVRVSWYDAYAYVRWLGAQLGTEIRLPNETEWEKAARGATGSIYPWGENYEAGYANINEHISGISATYLRQAVAVGAFPHAASTYGTEDMIGNVWEWCVNLYDDPAVMDAVTEGQRVLRGGSWRSERLVAHTVRRRGELPGTRYDDIGFRVVCNRLPEMW